MSIIKPIHTLGNESHFNEQMTRNQVPVPMTLKMVNKQSVSNNRVIIYNPVKISRPN